MKDKSSPVLNQLRIAWREADSTRRKIELLSGRAHEDVSKAWLAFAAEHVEKSIESALAS